MCIPFNKMMDPMPIQLDVYRTSIPMRGFEHATASRDMAESIVVRLELADGTVGWGETLPRDYVTGETLETVPVDIERVLWPAVRRGYPQGKDLPVADATGRCINAARCAVELARFDAWGRYSSPRRAPDTGPGRPFPDVTVSGVLGSRDPARTARRLWLMRLYGMTDFKLKLGLGDEIDAENLRVVDRKIGKAVAKGKCTLRVDVNGAWSIDETPERVAALVPHGVCVVEQPVDATAGMLVELAQRCELPLMADESLITLGDADILLDSPGKPVWLNVRLSKNGGLWPARSIIEAAVEADVPFVIGCMVGESSILSAAQRHLVWCAGMVRFVEGNYGRGLLSDDLSRRSLRFGYRGRLGPPKCREDGGLGVEVDSARLDRYGRLVRALRV